MGSEQANLLMSCGVPAERILIGHCDRNLDWDYHLALANLGVTLGYDQIGKEKYHPDSERVAFIKRLVEYGFGGQIAQKDMIITTDFHVAGCSQWSDTAWRIGGE